MVLNTFALFLNTLYVTEMGALLSKLRAVLYSTPRSSLV